MITIPGKIPISIHPLFWLVALFIGWMSSFTFSGTLIALGVVVISVLLHEFGHALTASLFGQKTRIELAAFGGFTYRQGRKLKLWEEFFVVLNGPLVGFILFLIASFILEHIKTENTYILFFLKFTALANLFWTVLNLIPVLPLDGGHLLSIILEAIFGFKGIKMAVIIGLILAVGSAIFFFVIGAFIIGALFLIFSFESFRSLRYYKIFKEKDRDDKLQDKMKKAETHLQIGEDDKSLALLNEVREEAKEGILYTLATEQVADIYKNQQRFGEAYALLLPLEKSLSNESMILLHLLAYKNRDYQKLRQLGKECYQLQPSAEIALYNAIAESALKDINASIGWLGCAIREGLSLDTALKHKEFDFIKNDSRFKAFLEGQR